MSERNLRIDTLRGLACLLLVSYHIIGATPSLGLRVNEGILRELNDYLGLVRMPLFTFLSGVVYAYRPFSSGAIGYVKGKVRRLLFPMLTVGTLFAVLQVLTPGTNSAVNNWYLLHIIPVAHFWFIESLFLIFIMLIPLEYYGAFNTPKGWTIVFFISVLLYISSINSNYFSLSGAIYLLPYFLLGMFIQRYKYLHHLSDYKFHILCLCILATIYIVYWDIDVNYRRDIVILISGSLYCLFLISTKLSFPLIAQIGIYSYSIYLFHVFFTAGSRIVLTKLGVLELAVIFILSLLAGVLGPICAERLLVKNKLIRCAVLGRKL